MQATNTRTFRDATAQRLASNQPHAQALGASHAAWPESDDDAKAAHAEPSKRAMLTHADTTLRVHPSQDVRCSCGPPERRERSAMTALHFNGRAGVT